MTGAAEGSQKQCCYHTIYIWTRDVSLRQKRIVTFEQYFDQGWQLIDLGLTQYIHYIFFFKQVPIRYKGKFQGYNC